MTRGDQVAIWVPRLLGWSGFGYTLLILRGDLPTPGWVLIGGMMGFEFVYRAQKRINDVEPQANGA